MSSVCCKYGHHVLLTAWSTCVWIKDGCVCGCIPSQAKLSQGKLCLGKTNKNSQDLRTMYLGSWETLSTVLPYSIIKGSVYINHPSKSIISMIWALADHQWGRPLLDCLLLSHRFPRATVPAKIHIKITQKLVISQATNTRLNIKICKMISDSEIVPGRKLEV